MAGQHRKSHRRCCGFDRVPPDGASVENAPALTTAAVTRGDVVESVDATGTLKAVTTVQVGTQVSGNIKALHADFNSRVRRGRVIAELEASLFAAQVEQARATLVRLEAEARRAVVQLEDARSKLKRAQELAATKLRKTYHFASAMVPSVPNKSVRSEEPGRRRGTIAQLGILAFCSAKARRMVPAVASLTASGRWAHVR